MAKGAITVIMNNERAMKESNPHIQVKGLRFSAIELMTLKERARSKCVDPKPAVVRGV